ncbi:MAG: hypothetical protein NTV39_02285 [Candidatus Saccharibacteria bacterium]|nr:hypothetical protein [Candidatus Saccharibacteria bacterium]
MEKNNNLNPNTNISQNVENSSAQATPAYIQDEGMKKTEDTTPKVEMGDGRKTLGPFDKNIIYFLLSPFIASILTGIIMGIFNIPYENTHGNNYGGLNVLNGLTVSLMYGPYVFLVAAILAIITNKIFKLGSTMRKKVWYIYFGISSVILCIYAIIEIVHPV